VYPKPSIKPCRSSLPALFAFATSATYPWSKRPKHIGYWKRAKSTRNSSLISRDFIRTPASSNVPIELTKGLRQSKIFGVVHRTSDDRHGVVGERRSECGKKLIGRLHAVSLGAETLGI
jgi:hypothetical protein